MYCKFKTCLSNILFLYFSAELSKIGGINQQTHPTQILTSLHRSPNWVITIEEKNFIQELCQLELNTSKSLPVPTSIMYMILNAAKTGTAIPVEVAVQGYSICMQRVIKYASSMEFFNRYSQFFFFTPTVLWILGQILWCSRSLRYLYHITTPCRIQNFINMILQFQKTNWVICMQKGIK